MHGLVLQKLLKLSKINWQCLSRVTAQASFPRHLRKSPSLDSSKGFAAVSWRVYLNTASCKECKFEIQMTRCFRSWASVTVIGYSFCLGEAAEQRRGIRKAALASSRALSVNNHGRARAYRQLLLCSGPYLFTSSIRLRQGFSLDLLCELWDWLNCIKGSWDVHCALSQLTGLAP